MGVFLFFFKNCLSRKINLKKSKGSLVLQDCSMIINFSSITNYMSTYSLNLCCAGIPFDESLEAASSIDS